MSQQLTVYNSSRFGHKQVSKDVVETQARKAARAGLSLLDSCPYPFGEEAGKHFVAVHAAATKRDADPAPHSPKTPHRPGHSMSNHPTPQWLVTADGTDQPINGLALIVERTVPSIAVIAHSLAQINRFTGHALRPYSVAEHSLLVADILHQQGHNCYVQRAGLMHDAHECMSGDVASPVKWAVGAAWLAFENPLALLLRKHYGLQSAYTSARTYIKHADLMALATERRDLTSYAPERNAPWPILDTPGAEVLPLEAVHLNTPLRGGMTWRHHATAFEQRYRALDAQCLAAGARVGGEVVA